MFPNENDDKPVNDSTNSEPLELHDEYLSKNIDILNMHSTKEIEDAIEKCKISILAISEMSEEKRKLVQQLVKLRLRLQDIQDCIVYNDPVKVKLIKGHKFTMQSVIQLKLASSKVHCDACCSLIWIPVQSWLSCSECGYISHRRCLKSVKRVCANECVLENPAYIKEICPERSLASQNYCCAECKSTISFGVTLRQPQLCDYSGFYFCNECHWGNLNVIPARVLSNWDMESYPVSRAAKQFLKIMKNKAVIHVESINPKLFTFVDELALKLRMDIMVMKEYLMSCRDALESKLLRLLEERQHFVDNPNLYTLQDLIDVGNKELVSYLQPIHEKLSIHITKECLGCQGKGHVCYLCDQPPVLFSFQTDAIVCSTCKGVCHRSCFIKREGVCMKCNLRSSREIV